MRKSLPQHYYNPLLRAIVEFDLIENGDRILIGLSGGKDSLFLTYALAVLQQHCRISFELEAITLNGGFSEQFDTQPLADFCAGLSMPFHTIDVDIAEILAADDCPDPCFSCAFFRRGAINRFAVEHQLNKVAYAHHHDDAVETFMLNMLYTGQLKTFMPKTYLDRSGITVIRPLLYFREQQLRDAVRLHGVTPIKNPCPYNGHTKRQEIKNLIASLEQQDRSFYHHLSIAMRHGNPIDLWPAPPPVEQLRQKHRQFWG